MRTIYYVTLALIVISNFTSASEPSGWNHKLALGEIGAGVGIGVALGFFLSYNDFSNASKIRPCDNMVPYPNYEAKAVRFWLIGNTIGAAGGVILIGETIGARSGNWPLSYALTTAASLAYPAILAAASPLEDITGALVIISPIISSVAATIVFNIVKKPIEETPNKTTGFELRPYSRYLTDSGGGYVTTYGVEVNF